MPYAWVDPDVAVVHNGQTVYHAYDEDSYEMFYWYTTDPAYCDEGNLFQFGFDVRELDYPEHLSAEDRDDHAAILAHAIDSGQLQFPDE